MPLLAKHSAACHALLTSFADRLWPLFLSDARAAAAAALAHDGDTAPAAEVAATDGAAAPMSRRHRREVARVLNLIDGKGNSALGCACRRVQACGAALCRAHCLGFLCGLRRCT